MEKSIPTSSSIIPTVDLSPFRDGGNESDRKKAKDIITEACTNFGVFLIENHDVPRTQIEKILEMSSKFYSYSVEERNKSNKGVHNHKKCGTGYYTKPIDNYHHFEYVLMYSPEIPDQCEPSNPPGYRETFEEVFKCLLKTAQTLEEIINECLGLPPNVLKEYNDDRRSDYLLAMNYPLSKKTGEIGIFDHEDPNMFTIVLQDICGLEACKDGEWIPIILTEGKMVVLIGDLLQVLSNKKFKSVTHRALRQKGKYRHAMDFCYNLQGEKWVEPLKELTDDIGVKPKYRGFYYKNYMDVKEKEDGSPPANPRDFIRITYYEI